MPEWWIEGLSLKAKLNRVLTTDNKKEAPLGASFLLSVVRKG